jgi:hypothetical protein
MTRETGTRARREALAMSEGVAPGVAMLEDVRAYDAMGEHRTASVADEATSAWLIRRLTDAGFEAALQHFEVPLFVPGRCELTLEDGAVGAFPAWPPVQTPTGGIAAPLALADAESLSGRIAVVSLPNAHGLWAAPGMGERVLDICQRGPAAVVAVTEHPSGEVIAMNAVASRFDWPVPVVIVGGREGPRLAEAAARTAAASLVSTGALTPDARAANVIARRPGEGRTVVLSTPKSGWFRCAGERGTGLTVFLHLAQWLVRTSRADLTLVAFSGHELDYLGGAHFLKAAAPAPAPDAVRLWLHIGANAAMQPLAVSAGAVRPDPSGARARRVTASPALLEAAGHAFTPAAGFGPPVEMSEATAAGEPSIIRRAGYGALAALIGANPLFHTPLDRAEVVTAPAELEAVAAAARAFLEGFVREG